MMTHGVLQDACSNADVVQQAAVCSAGSAHTLQARFTHAFLLQLYGEHGAQAKA